MRYEKTPTTTGRCWNCKESMFTHLLPHVRRIVCINQSCKALHPCETREEYDARKNRYGQNAAAL